MSSDSLRKQHVRQKSSCFGGWISHLAAFVLGCAVTSFWPKSQDEQSIAVLSGGSVKKSLVSSNTLRASSSECEISLGTYHGSEYTSAQTVGKPKCLVESKFIKIQQHQVQFTPQDEVIPDWIWIDYHDRINVLVQAPDSKDEFLIFEQTKYALEGRQSLAIVGGIIEPGEDPEEAARREVQEEMKQVCKEFHFLGRYRTDVNRGGGWTNTYLATHCHKTDQELEHRDDEVGVADTERQDLRRISLHDLKEAVLAGKFLEIQWSATVALALSHPELFDSVARGRNKQL